MQSPATRDLTVAEMFFKAPTTVNVPYSLPPAALPEPVVAPVSPQPAPNLSKKQYEDNAFITRAKKFVGENWQSLLALTIAAGVLIYGIYKKVNEPQKLKTNPPETENKKSGEENKNG